MLTKLRLLGAVFLSVLAVVFVPSTGWAAYTGADYINKLDPCMWGTRVVVPTNCNYSPGVASLSIVTQTTDLNFSTTGGWGVTFRPEGSTPPKVGDPDPNKTFCNGCSGNHTFNVSVALDPAVQKAYDVYAVKAEYGSTVTAVTPVIGSFLAAKNGGTVSGPVPPPPIDDACSTATGDFAGVQTYVDFGTLDVSWKWAGPLPARGWDVTNATSVDPVGFGTVQTTVPTTELTGKPGRFGLLGYTIPTGVTSMRVQQHGRPSCFFGFSVQRDASGAVTGVTLGGVNPPDTTGDAGTGTDESGSNCGTFDVFCQIKYLFVPHPSEWGVGELLANADTRPPFSAIHETSDSLTTAYTSLTGAGSGCNFPDFGLRDGFADDVQGNGSDVIPCDVGHRGGLGLLYDGVAAGLIIVTAIYCFHILRSAVDKG